MLQGPMISIQPGSFPSGMVNQLADGSTACFQKNLEMSLSGEPILLYFGERKPCHSQACLEELSPISFSRDSRGRGGIHCLSHSHFSISEALGKCILALGAGSAESGASGIVLLCLCSSSFTSQKHCKILTKT